MFTFITFPWPLPSANLPLFFVMNSRSVQGPPRPAVTAGSLT